MLPSMRNYQAAVVRGDFRGRTFHYKSLQRREGGVLNGQVEARAAGRHPLRHGETSGWRGFGRRQGDWETREGAVSDGRARCAELSHTRALDFWEGGTGVSRSARARARALVKDSEARAAAHGGPLGGAA